MKFQNNQYSRILTMITIIVLLFLTTSCQEKADVAENKSKSTSTEAPNVDIHTAVISNNLEAIKQHIKAKSDINVQDPLGGSTPLISACLFGKTEIAKALINAGAKLDIQNNDKSTALITAAFFGRLELVELLLEKGADKTIKNKYGSTAYQSVSDSFDKVKPGYDMFGKMLKPMGLVLDYDHLKKTRPVIAQILKD